MNILLLLLGVLACCSEQIYARRITKRNSGKDLNAYLTDFGYLAPANLETGALRSSDELTNAVKNLQKMGGLRVTGDPKDPELKELLVKDRCGVTDRQVNKDPSAPQSFHVSNFKWDKKVVTWKIKSFSQDMDHAEQRKKFYEAFDIWHQEADLEFHEVGATDDADIVISFDRYEHGDGYPLDGPGRVLAHAFPPGPGRQGDAHFDEDEEWGANGKGTDLYTVAAHEFGHSLGIYHSNKKGALMFPWYQGYNPNLELEYDDVQAIQTIYGGPPRGRSTKKQPKYTFSTYPATSPRRVTPSPRIPEKPDGVRPPDPCKTTIDDVALIRTETYAFRDKWYWRIGTNGQLVADEPLENKYFWEGLPKERAINAVTDLPKIDLSIFFIGRRYWLVRARTVLSNFPKEGRDISNLGILDQYVDKIDAAMLWGFNHRVYIFSGHIYWRLSNQSRHMTNDGQHLHVDKGYPKSFDLWEGIPVPVDGAYTNHKGETFFFKGTQYWGFDDQLMRVKPNYPQDISEMLNCVYGLRSSGGSVGPMYMSVLLSALLPIMLLNLSKF